jgi:hypothetical protein
VFAAVVVLARKVAISALAVFVQDDFLQVRVPAA